MTPANQFPIGTARFVAIRENSLGGQSYGYSEKSVEEAVADSAHPAELLSVFGEGKIIARWEFTGETKKKGKTSVRLYRAV